MSSTLQKSLDLKVAQVSGLAPECVDFLSQSLYPPGEHTQIGVPAVSSGPTVRFDYRPTTTITNTVIPDGASWDCIIVTLPGDTNAAHFATCLSGSLDNFYNPIAPANNTAGVMAFNAHDAANVRQNAVTARDSAGVLTKLPHSAYYNPNRVVGYRHSYRSLTVHNSSSALVNGGTLCAASIDVAWARAPNCERFARAVTGNVMVARHQAYVPLTEPDLSSMVPGVMVADAKDGAFVPCRITSTDFIYPTVSHGARNSNATADYTCIETDNVSIESQPYLPAYAHLEAAGASAAGRPWWMAQLLATSTYQDETAYGGMSMGIVMLRSLPKQAVLTVMVHAGIEALVAPNSTFRAMARVPVAPSELAMRTYFAIVNGMPRAYPARDNSIGALIPMVLNALKAAAPTLLRTAATVIPGVASALPVVKEIIDATRDPGVRPRQVEARARPRARSRSASVASTVRAPRKAKKASILRVKVRAPSRSLSRRRQ